MEQILNIYKNYHMKNIIKLNKYKTFIGNSYYYEQNIL